MNNDGEISFLPHRLGISAISYSWEILMWMSPAGRLVAFFLDESTKLSFSSYVRMEKFFVSIPLRIPKPSLLVDSAGGSRSYGNGTFVPQLGLWCTCTCT
jgi:hypothetical protein